MNVDLRNRAPTVERLPDSRQRVTRVADVLNWIPKTPEDILAQVWLAWGTADAEYANCRLIKQDVRGQPEDFPDQSKRPPVVIRVYEEISASGETQVGNPGIEFDQYGNKIVTIDSIQLSTGTATFQVVGSTAAPAPNDTAILKDEARTNDGTLQRIRRVYTTGGLMSQSDEFHNYDKLLIRTLTYLNQIPPTPAGFINISQKTEYVRGLPAYTYGFAKGDGEISRSVDYSMSIDQGVTGVTKTTIRYLVAPGGTIQPTSLPGSVLVAQSYTDEDGYRVWTTTWAKGTGTISSSTQIREGGKLIIYNASSLNSAPSTPAATIGGTVTLTSSGSRIQDGYTIYEASWAEGVGQISQDDETKNNGALLLRTIRYLTALSVSSNPIATPSGYTLTSSSYAEQDGYRLWTAAYAKGDGQISTETQTRNNGALLIQSIRYISTPLVASNPITTPVGYTLTDVGYSDQDGHRVWSASYAKGLGEISRSIDYVSSSNQGATGITRTTIRYLVAPSGTVQPTSLSGSVLIGQDVQEQDGHRIWTTTWATGTGVISTESRNAEGTLIFKTDTTLVPAGGSAPVEPANLVSRSIRNESGYQVYTDVYISSGFGQISQDDDTKNNGALLIRTIRYASTAATSTNPISTPAGYTLTSEAYAQQSNYRIWTASYAKGTGEISRDEDTKNNGALLLATIRYLSTPSVSINPIVTPSGYTNFSVTVSEQDGYKLWTASYAKGVGQTISVDDEIKNNGQLYLRTIRYISTPSVSSNPIATPTDYTNVSYQYSDQDGYRLWTASYAKGTGQISRDDDIKNNGALLLASIRYLSLPSVSSNPITTPSGYTNVSYGFSEQDGYRVWTASYAKGNGQISQDDEIKNNGQLLLRSIRYLSVSSVASNPILTPVGYTNTSYSYSDQDGYRLWAASYAKGAGEINRSVDYISSSDQGATGITKTTIRYLTAPSGTIQPTSFAGSVLISQDAQDQDGYRIWTTTWAKGTGTISVENRNAEGTLVIKTDIILVNSGDAPPADPSNLISKSVKNESGYQAFTYVYIDSGFGQISQDDDTKNNGALLIRTIRYASASSTTVNPIATPVGYTLTSEVYTQQSNYRIWTASYAKGNGQISREDDIRNNGALLTATIRYLSTPLVSTNPITTPIGYTLTSESYADQDGYRLWTAAYALGTGQISQDDDTKNNGALLIRTIRQISTPAVTSNPIATPTNYTVFSVAYADQDGHRVWTASYAKGSGQISQDDELKNNDLLLIRTIKYLSAPSVASNPITTPVGYTNFSVSFVDQDGYRIWTAGYAKGAGEISREIDYVSSSDQGTTGITRTTIRYLTGPAGTVLPTSLAGSVKIGQNLQEQDGYRIWTTNWATGTGTISTETRYEEGTLVVKTDTILVAAGGAAPATPSNLISRSVRNESGYQVYVDNYISSGSGQTAFTRFTRADASEEVNVTDIGAAAATPADPLSGGYLTGLRNQKQAGGYYVNQATYIYVPPTITLKKQVSFPMPGLASFSGNQLVFSPQTSRTLIADQEVSYSTAQLTDAPFSVNTWASYQASYTPTATGVPAQEVKGLGGYIGSGTVVGTNGNFNGVLCDSYAASITNSSPTARPTGLTVLAVDNDIYLKTVAGTVVYRRTKTTYTF